MNRHYPFDSRDPLYREHIGAVAEGTPLRLRLLLHLDAHCTGAFLRIREDREEQPREIWLTPGGLLDGYRFYEGELTLGEGLYWYSFRYTSDYGTFFVNKTDTSLGIVTDGSGGWWQQTVCAADFTTPAWLRGGVIYQIFPDRFCRSGQKKEGVPDDRFLCSDWAKQPEYRQTGEKLTLGNDYYGGDLAGITEKLPYLASLGVTCLYLNPIFVAHSNHRYNTADYLKIDPMLGTEEDFTALCRKAEEYGISVILDGVFSHTGDDSIYFNRTGRYGAGGAYHGEEPYRSWYKFRHYPDDYAAWWGVKTLPETEENDPSFTEFITGENGVLRYWMRRGCRGWRLDVADELPDDFLDHVRAAVKAEDPDGYLLGEVWEDASNKISYGVRRRFLRGRQLDAVMNYPFANAVIDFVRGGDAAKFNETVCTVLEHYPSCCVHLLMNHVGTHDTARLLTRLTVGDDVGDRSRQASLVLSGEQYACGRRLVRLAAVLQYTLPGVPSLYYGDEAGAQGCGDPFCRAGFPWGREDAELTDFYRTLGKMRHDCAAFREGEYLPLVTEPGRILYERRGGGHWALIAVNRTDTPWEIAVPDNCDGEIRTVLGNVYQGMLTAEAMSPAILCGTSEE